MRATFSSRGAARRGSSRGRARPRCCRRPGAGWAGELASCSPRAFATCPKGHVERPGRWPIRLGPFAGFWDMSRRGAPRCHEGQVVKRGCVGSRRRSVVGDRSARREPTRAASGSPRRPRGRVEGRVGGSPLGGGAAARGLVCLGRRGGARLRALLGPAAGRAADLRPRARSAPRRRVVVCAEVGPRSRRYAVLRRVALLLAGGREHGCRASRGPVTRGLASSI